MADPVCGTVTLQDRDARHTRTLRVPIKDFSSCTVRKLCKSALNRARLLTSSSPTSSICIGEIFVEDPRLSNSRVELCSCDLISRVFDVKQEVLHCVLIAQNGKEEVESILSCGVSSNPRSSVLLEPTTKYCVSEPVVVDKESEVSRAPVNERRIFRDEAPETIDFVSHQEADDSRGSLSCMAPDSESPAGWDPIRAITAEHRLLHLPSSLSPSSASIWSCSNLNQILSSETNSPSMPEVASPPEAVITDVSVQQRLPVEESKEMVESVPNSSSYSGKMETASSLAAPSHFPVDDTHAHADFLSQAEVTRKDEVADEKLVKRKRERSEDDNQGSNTAVDECKPLESEFITPIRLSCTASTCDGGSPESIRKLAATIAHVDEEFKFSGTVEEVKSARSHSFSSIQEPATA